MSDHTAQTAPTETKSRPLSAEEKKNQGYLAGGVSIAVNVFLFALKLWAGLTYASLALIADAWHTLSDSLSSIIVLVAVKLASKKADREHPFGHGRWEQIGAIFIAVFLAIVAYKFAVDAIEHFQNHQSATFGPLATFVTIISIVVKEGLAQYAFLIARKTQNATIKADGWHHRSDALSSLVVLIGILVSRYFWWIDSVLGLIIALMLAHATYEIVKEAIVKLLGEAPSEPLKAQIRSIAAKTYKGNLELHHFHLHNYVNHQEMTFHILLPGEISLLQAHEIATTLEDAIFEELGIISTSHIEPLGHHHGESHPNTHAELHADEYEDSTDMSQPPRR